MRAVLIFFISILTAMAVLTSFKLLLGLLIFAIMLAVLVPIYNKRPDRPLLLHLTILSIPFPIVIQFFGKDALSFTIIFIFMLFIYAIFSGALNVSRIKLLSPEMIIPVLLILDFTLSLALNMKFPGQSIRYYIANISGIFLYYSIIFLVSRKSEIITLFKIIVFALFCQVIISVLQLAAPKFAAVLMMPFGTRVGLSYGSLVEGSFRCTGFILDYELLALWFVIGIIISLALAYAMKKNHYLLYVAFLAAGIVLTKTRSALFLLAAAIIIMEFTLNAFRKNRNHYSEKAALLLLISSIAAVILMPKQITILMHRISEYLFSFDLLSPYSINRGEVWEMARGSFLRNLTFFGKGLYNVETDYYVQASSFHSLYLTLLYKTGIVGLGLHVLFWLYLIKASLTKLSRFKNDLNWYLTYFLSLSLVIMLADGLKVEYLRYAHTIQFAWMIFGLIVATWRLPDEDTLVSEAAVRHR